MNSFQKGYKRDANLPKAIKEKSELTFSMSLLLAYRKLSFQFPDVTNWNDNTSLAEKGALAHRLQRRTNRKIQNGRQGAQKWPMGSGKGCFQGFWVLLSTFTK